MVFLTLDKPSPFGGLNGAPGFNGLYNKLFTSFDVLILVANAVDDDDDADA